MSTPKTPDHIRFYLEQHRQCLEYGPASIVRVLTLAHELLHECKLATSEPSPLATQANIVSLVDCARMATGLLQRELDSVFEALDAAGGAA
ncbi:hypothetical protein [uncultured Thiodictyon sp.]|jgi:hypothetical protein|uniref:hypothetical protein n=1 Tax=uncultured Thiodictyon sp. TaxID=1846217 RepID=UPI0025CE71FE|nr:hypothetical protein [uncultured Thiodictyon sp.]